MGWIREHPYAAALATTGLVIIAGALIVAQNAPVPPANNATIAWSGASPLASETQNTEPQSTRPQQIAAQVVGAPPNLQTTPITRVTLPTPPPTTSASAQSPTGPFNYAALIAEISGPSTAPQNSNTDVTSAANQALSEAYAAVPTSLIATTTPPKKQMTENQDALYEYGNEVGSTIQSFETQHPNQAQVVDNQAQDRTDPTKAAALTSLGKGLAGVGNTMSQMDDVPDSMTSLHNALASSYQDIGAKLQLVAQAQGDSAFVTAVQNYDVSADTFTKNYAAVALYLSASGIVFTPEDPGSVFSFNDASSL